jgi:GNAT superfamily N-acetyltransferase
VLVRGLRRPATFLGQTSDVVLIRDADAGDLDELRVLFRRSALSNDGDREAMLAHPEVLEFSLPVSGAKTRVAVVDGRIAGFATALRSGSRVELEDLFVDPDLMRGGVGTALVDDVEVLAKAQRCDRIEVTANPHALVFYERVGFVVEGEVDTTFGPAQRMSRAVPLASDQS